MNKKDVVMGKFSAGLRGGLSGCKAFGSSTGLALGMLLLSGCANNYFRVSPVLDHPKESSGAIGDGRSAYLKPISFDEEPYKTYLSAANDQEKPDVKQASGAPRNKLQNIIIEHSDAMCEKHKGDILGGSASTNLVLGIGAATASTISAIVTGAAATNYAAGATILNAGRSEINSDVYQGMLATAIVKAIEESRDKKMGEVKANQAKSPTEYSVRSAIVDAQDYHFRCSFYHGLVVLNEDAKKRATPSREELKAHIEERTAELSRLAASGVPASDATWIRVHQSQSDLWDELNILDRAK